MPDIGFVARRFVECAREIHVDFGQGVGGGHFGSCVALPGATGRRSAASSRSSSERSRSSSSNSGASSRFGSRLEFRIEDRVRIDGRDRVNRLRRGAQQSSNDASSYDCAAWLTATGVARQPRQRVGAATSSSRLAVKASSNSSSMAMSTASSGSARPRAAGAGCAAAAAARARNRRTRPSIPFRGRCRNRRASTPPIARLDSDRRDRRPAQSPGAVFARSGWRLRRQAPTRFVRRGSKPMILVSSANGSSSFKVDRVGDFSLVAVCHSLSRTRTKPDAGDVNLRPLPAQCGQKVTGNSRDLAHFLGRFGPDQRQTRRQNVGNGLHQP